ncbi:hypothetical protein H0H93_016144 [Arthromyces matolae]|nr:hypothetical protein H0H93_016144 [Arthromyces matolae]
MACPHPKRSLLLIDLQNDFIVPDAPFRIHTDSLPFLNRLQDVVTAFRVSNYPIFWIRSNYPVTTDYVESPLRNNHDPINFLAGTHKSKTPSCVKGTSGAEFPSNVQALIDDPSFGELSQNVVVTKTWYSAFKETPLHDELRQRGITELFVAGILSNVCVNATVNDALVLDFRVSLLEDCLGWRKRGSHDRALRAMSKLGAQILSIEDICGTAGPRSPTFDFTTRRKLPELYYVNGSIPSWRVMMALYEKGIKFKSTRLLVMSDPKETRSPEFLTLNHRGKTPVFVDVLADPDTPGDPRTDVTNNSETTEKTLAINESIAILHYIESYHNPNRPLLPPVTHRAAYARALARIQETENLRLIYDELEDAHFDAERVRGGKLDSSQRSRLIAKVDHELDYWETYAKKSAFIAGDEFGLADCAFFPILAYMVHRGFEWRRRTDDGFEDSWPNLKAYHQRVWERGGANGSAQKSQPVGWERVGKANVWRGTKRNAKGIYHKNKKRHDNPVQPQVANPA